VSEDTILYTVGAGEDLDTVIADTIEQGWWGMENLSAIPSSIGAVPVQNVGAYGVEASQLIVTVRVFNQGTNRIELWSREQCQFAYRDSIFKHTPGCQAIVLAVTFALSTTPTPRLKYKDLFDYFGSTTPTQKEIRDAIISIRSKKFPDWRTVGTAGSFFKNPIISTEEAESLKQQYADVPIYETDVIDKKKISLGFVLDKICHRKGYQEGNVSLYEHQALVLCVVPHTDAQAVIDFAKKITDEVFLATQISIEWEVVLLS
jgi:UDP-N-acetylmuramate dehydrogenase